MTTKRNKSKGKAGLVIRARVDASLKLRLTDYRKRPDVQRSEGFVTRRAVEEFLDQHAKTSAAPETKHGVTAR